MAIPLKSDINILIESVICEMFENQQAIGYGEKPLYISHKPMCIQFDLGNKKSEIYVKPLFAGSTLNRL